MSTPTEQSGHPSGDGLDIGTLKLMLEALDDFVAAELPESRMLELDDEDVCPEDTVRAMCSDALGVQLVFVPEEYGGLGGRAFDSYRVCERMASIDLGLATSAFATFLGSDPILMGGTEEQKKNWLGRIAAEGLVFAYGATEPEAGSDLAAMTTSATPVEADGEVTGYRITGRKQWISNGTIADAYTILAMAPGGPSWFIVERDAQGFSAAPKEHKHGIRLSDTAALFLDDVLVSADRLVSGVEGLGLVQAQQVFGYTRVMVAAFGLGCGCEAMERAIRYSTQRVQGGAPLSEKQGYTHKLIVPQIVRLEAARAVVEQTATRLDAGESTDGALNTEGAIAKYLASEAGVAAADAAVQAHGGYGYTRPYIVEKIRRDVRITTIYEGTSEILEMTIARDRWQLHLKTGGAYFADAARTVRALHTSHPSVGADTAALGLESLAMVFEACRAARLTRNQHVLLRLGELVAHAEGAAALVQRAVAAAEGRLPDKADKRYGAAALAAMSRVYGREAALRVAEEGARWVCGAADRAISSALVAALPFDAVRAAQAGLISDMDAVADVIYDRVTT
jgi:acyl-CoA dehydrogenase